MGNKKLLIGIIIAAGAIILIGALILVFCWYTGPKRFVNQYFSDIKAGKQFVMDDTYHEFIKEDYQDYYKDIEDEWRKGKNLSYKINKDEAWRQQVTVTTDEEGDEIEEVTKFKPFYQWFSSNYRAWVTIKTGEKKTETYVLEFKRKSGNEWNIFSYLTSPWLMYDIWYEDEYEDYISFDEDFSEEDIIEIEPENTNEVIENTNTENTNVENTNAEVNTNTEELVN